MLNDNYDDSHPEDIEYMYGVFTTKDDGICTMSLKQFKDNHSIRKAYYNASKNEMKFHRKQTCTCYKESSLPVDQIVENISKISEAVNAIRKADDEYSKKNLAKLHELNNSIITYCMTGITDDKTMAISEYLNGKVKSSPIMENPKDKTDSTTLSETDEKTKKPAKLDKMSDYNIIVNLKPGDHIYRDLFGRIEKFFGHHHGIVYQIPDPELDNDIYNGDETSREEKNEALYDKYLNQVIIYEMTRKYGICKRTLKHFKCDIDGDGTLYPVWLVSYGVSKCRIWQGTCHQEAKLPVKKILLNVEKLYNHCRGNKDMYSLVCNNSGVSSTVSSTAHVSSTLVQKIILGATIGGGIVLAFLIEGGMQIYRNRKKKNDLCYTNYD